MRVSGLSISELLAIGSYLHAPSDYTVRGERADGTPWQCRVVANPLGYARKDEQAYFQPRSCIDL